MRHSDGSDVGAITVGLKDIDAINDQGEARVIYLPSARQDGDPEAAAARAEVRRLLERAVDQLPEHFRVVFMLRDIEEMSVEETASHLGLRTETVKTRLHRARRLLRQALDESSGQPLATSFPAPGRAAPGLRRPCWSGLGCRSTGRSGLLAWEP